ncbi:uncharacterized protein LOC112192991 isoform X2 [Rosa chinensis]|uniref:uncharacterized protein LOC112192991 isoform X2 n=1 Tax=Rosa chinensis TaxID=74649 RepID=UPI000D093187|nr:uncharacterized protein LOC112192991 isoform X2 [Rosa chinensis]
MWWLLRRTTLLSPPLLRRSFPPRQIRPPEKMSFRNDGNSPATPGGNSVISLSPVSATNVGNRDCQILKVGSIPILIYDSFGNVVKRPIGFGVTSGFSDEKQCASLSDGIRFDEMRSKVEDACVSSNSESASEREHERWSPMPDWKSQLRECSLPTEFGMKRKHHSRAEKRHSVPRNLKNAPVTKSSGLSKRLHCYEPFDICLDGRNSALEASFHARMMEAEDTVEFANPERMVESKDPVVLRPGMVLLKNYVSLSQQVEIVKTCRELGLGPGGFYQPVFQHGRKLHLQMMCLGRNWDPETRIYEVIRPIDDTRPPGIPNEFSLLVERAIQEAHAHLKDKIICSSVEKVLPSMTPDICIANFYTTSGRLGLHQMKF